MTLTTFFFLLTALCNDSEDIIYQSKNLSSSVSPVVYSHNQPFKKNIIVQNTLIQSQGKKYHCLSSISHFRFTFSQYVQHFQTLTIQFYFIEILLQTQKNRSCEWLDGKTTKKLFKIICNNLKFYWIFIQLNWRSNKHCNWNHLLPFLFTVISLLYMVTLCVISLHMCVRLRIISLMHCCLPLRKASK